ncbi:embryogenesis transmembrane protein [Carex littledalei]|uniref:Embryogenesis transmembrane protein n=1 Tax=Carex littledalei TaxID=544730 RepID=A0A833QHE6_9POAL|nr:embryogenesis transmembrane protein [Carex littledalei]
MAQISPANAPNPETEGAPLQNGLNPTTPRDSDDQEFFKEIRGGLMIVAILAAGSTYQAGLNPPGGIWQEDDPDRDIVAGMSILHDRYFNRYQTFFYCNAISFLSSLVIIILLMNKNIYRDRKSVKVLEITLVLDLFSFMAAYAVGSCRLVTTSIYIFLLMGGVFAYVISFARHYSFLQHIAEMMPCSRPPTLNTEQHRELDHV